MKKKIIVIFISILFSMITISNHGEANNENENSQNYALESITLTSSNIRQPAEFERMEGVLISYNDLVNNEDDFGIPYALIAEMAEDVKVITIVDSESQKNDVQVLLENNDVDLKNCSFLIAPSNSYWTRDYGPWFIFNETINEMKVVGFEYNRPRPNDNDIPYAFALNQSLNYTYMDLIHSGGNYMTDGQGISVSTQLVWDENPAKTHDEINQIMDQYLAVHTYHLRPDVNNEYIKHIDCWAKSLSADTIMIREVPSSHSQYDEIEAAVDYFKIQTSCYGTPYNIVRVYTPYDEPYTNSLILNEKVFVPLQGTQWDMEALESYETAMPGYEILGFYAGKNRWLPTDAIHCRIKGIPDRNMLYIEHIPLSGYNGFNVKAKIIPFSGANVNTAFLFWKLEGDYWESTEMIHIDDFSYEANIPIQKSGETVYYYIKVEDNSRRIESHPFIGEADPHTFYVYNVPPKKPNIIGENDGKVETEYEYTFTSTDPEGDEVSYYIDWGDGNITNWTDFQTANTPYIESHTWSKQGQFTVTAKSKDTLGAESNWATLNVNMPKTKQIYSPLLRFLENHPHLFPILRLFITSHNIVK
jgi:agmatine/peptidylarginine deiminase